MESLDHRQTKSRARRITRGVVGAWLVSLIVFLNPYWMGTTVFGLDLAILMGFIEFFVIVTLAVTYQILIEQVYHIEGSLSPTPSELDSQSSDESEEVVD